MRRARLLFLAAVASCIGETRKPVEDPAAHAGLSRTATGAAARTDRPDAGIDPALLEGLSACGSLKVLHPASAVQKTKPRDPAKGEAEFQRGTALTERGEHEAAKQAYTSAILADPDHGLAYLGAAESHLYTDDDHAAMKALLERAVELLPENPRAHLRYGDYFASVGQRPDAKAEWRCALELREDLVDARLHLARLLLENGELEVAEREVRSAITVTPDALDARILLADILEAEKRYIEAAGEVMAAAKLATRSAALYRRAGLLFEAGGNLMAAKKARKQADTLDPPPKARNMRPLLKRKKSS